MPCPEDSFSLEIFVENINLFENQNIPVIALAFRIFDFPSVLLYADRLNLNDNFMLKKNDDSDLKEKSILPKDQMILFDKGKNWIFSVKRERLFVLVNTVPMYALIISVNDENVERHAAKFIGSLAIDLSNLIQKDESVPVQGFKRGIFTFFDLMGREVGNVQMVIRLSCLGQSFASSTNIGEKIVLDTLQSVEKFSTVTAIQNYENAEQELQKRRQKAEKLQEELADVSKKSKLVDAFSQVDEHQITLELIHNQEVAQNLRCGNENIRIQAAASKAFCGDSNVIATRTQKNSVSTEQSINFNSDSITPNVISSKSIVEKDQPSNSNLKNEQGKKQQNKSKMNALKLNSNVELQSISKLYKKLQITTDQNLLKNCKDGTTSKKDKSELHKDMPQRRNNQLPLKVKVKPKKLVPFLVSKNAPPKSIQHTIFEQSTDSQRTLDHANPCIRNSQNVKDKTSRPIDDVAQSLADFFKEMVRVVSQIAKSSNLDPVSAVQQHPIALKTCIDTGTDPIVSILDGETAIIDKELSIKMPPKVANNLENQLEMKSLDSNNTEKTAPKNETVERKDNVRPSILFSADVKQTSISKLPLSAMLSSSMQFNAPLPPLQSNISLKSTSVAYETKNPLSSNFALKDQIETSPNQNLSLINANPILIDHLKLKTSSPPYQTYPLVNQAKIDDIPEEIYEADFE